MVVSINVPNRLTIDKRVPDLGHYTLDGNPIPLQRARHGISGHVYDPQKDSKFGSAIQLKNQHQGLPFFQGPLKLEVTFFMPLPYKKRLKDNMAAYHKVRPDLDNLIKYILDCANGILYKDDALIAIIVARKIHSALARTEFTLTRICDHDETEIV